MTDRTLGERELDVMGVLWTLGSGTVAEVRDRLPASLAYTTVLTILRNLEAKGFVRHDAEGKAHRYVPLVAHATARRSALARLVDKLFHGSAELLVAELVRDRAIDAGELARLAEHLRDTDTAGHADAPTRSARSRRTRRSS
jgi:BlaI family transcriptional regulator, penicillinase repressor